MDLKLPSNISTILKGFDVEDGPRGLSGAGLYRFHEEDEVYYLKIIDNSSSFAHELEKEYKVLEWLKGKLPAPKALAFERAFGKSFLLMEEVKGFTLEGAFNREGSIEKTVKIYAESLRLIHSVDVEGCPVKADDDSMLLEARKNIDLGINLELMEEEYKNITPLELYNRMLSIKPKKNDNVFIHGDYCMDNIIIKDGRLNGIIDVGRGGIGDRYKDIALAIRNIKGDFGEQWLDLFFSTYGIVDPDWKKIEFYIMMDEFF